ncbi:MAG: pentapeptide repeat-containing protein [Leptolyngbyaceae cyanobacterium MAG.088]|nr:pentapeptide repeat-containing protein [Leptolyngbyaceae cyanobacterium MAG.088]
MLTQANLSGVKFWGATLTGASLEDADLRGAKIEQVIGLQP